MKKIHLFLLFSLAVLSASSQKVYFVYIQTESEQPFFVKMNEKVNSSTASGYIILSKLLDSTYSFSIGFPQNKWQEQSFSVPVNKKDHGYLLKNFGEKGWGLFDLQTLAIQMATTNKTSQVEKPKVENNDVSAFTEILSKAADDPSLKEKPAQEVVKKDLSSVAEQPKAEVKETVVVKPVEAIEQLIAKKDSSAVAEEPKAVVKETVNVKPVVVVEQPIIKKEDPKIEIKEVVVAKPVVAIEQPIAKKDSFAVTEDPKVEIKETVIAKPVKVIEQPIIKKEEPKIEIKEAVVVKPAETIAQPVNLSEETKTAVLEPYRVSQVKKWSESSTTEGFGLVFIDDYENGIMDTIRLVIPNPKTVVNVVKDEPKEEKKFIDISTEAPKKEELPVTTVNKIVETKSVVTEVAVEKSTLKNNCNELAAESDFFKLRKKMATVENDDDMISEAKKYFKVKCFTSAHLKNLSSLFLNDEGKYKFFDVSYKYVSDAEAFTNLQSELKDEYYVSRFKAMLRN